MPLLDNLIGFAKLRLEPVQNRLNRGVFRYPPPPGELLLSYQFPSLFLVSESSPKNPRVAVIETLKTRGGQIDVTNVESTTRDTLNVIRVVPCVMSNICKTNPQWVSHFNGEGHRSVACVRN